MDSDGPTGGRPPAGRGRTFDVGPGDSGVRVSVRRRLPEGGLGDVLGVLQSWADGLVQVQRRDEVVVSIREADIVAAKRIGPAPERRTGG